MKSFLKKALVIGAISVAPVAFAADMTGAGATFPYPMYAKWAEAYKAKTGSNLNYQSIGSSGGIKQIKAKTVDFGASDNPVKFEDLEKDGLVQFPAIIGGVVPVINVEGVKPYELKLSPDTLADIFQGVITNWNDRRLVLNNPGLKMPDMPITVVHRADGSGTTAIFTNYLAKVSQNWKEAVGEGAAVKWPAASSVGGKGNEGVAANVSRVKGAIGYVEYAYAKKNKLISVSLKNKDGQFVQPDDTTFAAAAAGTDWSKIPGMGTFITNATGAKSWPITGASFILMYKNPEKKANSAEVLKFFDFAFKEGKQMALELNYVPMPDVTTDFIRKNVWSSIATK
ncbi:MULTISPECIES: phosphate ABC transporter substrate-binding protein PstS [unclassified Polynucleobacter]|uniref:phosphate ABC transporter substrate-binding protein PstS n=1 Tax=unclassified Polynucleobacter TaxID=2640945 RepID=UPI0008B5CA6B|nr:MULTISPECIES: phosphate ABC transporter substrate-binding protein PstS [unclassified Polynucleobacter]OHC10200.1 MAG: phosphate ABC transporter substrate-binding protein PstS [Polynucleobacter sp. GWA2_45_21]HBK43700.1 phosphate ABC transporter substrate-binding protein PstS [Polynucleobacter sp.]